MGQLTTVLLFLKLLPKNLTKFAPKIQSTTKQRMLRATNLRQSREFYTNAVGDVGDIQKVCIYTHQTVVHAHTFIYRQYIVYLYLKYEYYIGSGGRFHYEIQMSLKQNNNLRMEGNFNQLLSRVCWCFLKTASHQQLEVHTVSEG